MTMTIMVRSARVRVRLSALSKASSTRRPKRARSAVSCTKAWMVRTALRLSSTPAPTSATRSWLSRESLRTLRPISTIGATTKGTASTTKPVNFGLVIASMNRPPTSSRRLRSAKDTEEPITVCSSVVSVVMRVSTSPVRVVSK